MIPWRPDPFFWVPFAVSLLVLFALERVVHVVIVLFGGSDAEEKAETRQLVSGAIHLGSSVVFGFLALAARVLSALLSALFWFVVVFCLLSLVSVSYEQYPSVWLYGLNFYNLRVAPFLNTYVLLPVEVLNVLFKGFVPIYNGVWWVLKTLLSKGFLPLIWQELRTVLDMGVGIIVLGQQCAASLQAYVQNCICDAPACLRSPTELDLLTPMGGVRSLAVLGASLGSNVCSVVGAPIELLLYPFFDVNLAQAVHHLVNAVLVLVVHTPQATAFRCKAYTGDLMCTPDWEPVKVRLVAGVRDLGELLDNWMGVAAARLQSAVAGQTSSSTVQDGASSCESTPGLSPDSFRDGLLEGETAVVGLTDWLLASTNATSAYFFGSTSASAAARLWPERIDPSLGVAAVRYADVNEADVSSLTQSRRPGSQQTTSMLGCRCLDTDQGLRVRCSFLSHSAALNATDASFTVWFQDDTWARRMTCAGVELSVRSVRWPAHRREGATAPFGAGHTDIPQLDCITRGTCESVDATIWLVPKCAYTPALCSSAAVGACFPYCMAARLSGTRNAAPVFVGAETWREGSQLMRRDCLLADLPASAGQSASFLPGWVTTLTDAAAGFAGVDTETFVTQASPTASPACSSAAGAVSWVPKSVSESVDESVLPFTRREGQPFAITGDTLLIADEQPDGGVVVIVERLTGDQRDTYTMRRAFNALPAAPRLLVPADEIGFSPSRQLVVPYEFQETRILATSSRDYVFYAVNPALQIFSAYFDWCLGAPVPQFQYLMLSSYAPLRIYRVRAYCSGDCEGLSAQYTFDSFSNGSFTGADFSSHCNRRFNVSVVALEYVNEQNVAVTVQASDSRFNTTTMVGLVATYQTYWLNPQTMAVRAGSMWLTDVPTDLHAALCTEGVPLPKLGSFAASVANFGLHLTAALVEAVTYTPGAVSFWRGGGACPIDGRGHSVLETCAEGLYSLDDAFDSLEDGTAILWGVADFAADVLGASGIDYAPARQVLSGMSLYGRATTDVTQVGNLVSILKVPVTTGIESVLMALETQSIGGAGAQLAVSSLSLARYGYASVVAVSKGMLQSYLAGGALTLGGLWRQTVASLYEKRGLFDTVVVQRGLSGCQGMGIILGGSNPWALVAQTQCNGAVLLLAGAVETLLTIFVEVPLVKCVCVDSAGYNAVAFARETCVPQVPLTLRPAVLGMASATEAGSGGLLCPAVTAFMNRALSAGFDPWFANSYAGLDALGSAVDYALIPFDDEAGQCLNFDSNPNVVVIVPQPVDYFQACGATSTCHTRCASEWAAFSEALLLASSGPEGATGQSASKGVTQSVESLFFPAVGVDIVPLGKILALTEPGGDYCASVVCPGTAHRCLAAAVLVQEEIVVQYYCVPVSPAQSVYATKEAGVNWHTGYGADVTQLAFTSYDGTEVALGNSATILRVTQSGGNDALLNVSAADAASVPLLLAMNLRGIRIIGFLAVRDRLLVNVAVRVTVDGRFSTQTQCLWVETATAAAYAVAAACNEWEGYAATEYPAASASHQDLLLWPTHAGLPPTRLAVDWTQPAAVGLVSTPFRVDTSLAAQASITPRPLTVCKNAREDASSGTVTAFANAGDSYDWLLQLRLAGSRTALTQADVRNSQAVTGTVTIVTECDGRDCRGCASLGLRALCAAYQSCSVFRCIGTPVNTNRPLCGVGLALRSAGMLHIETVHGAWVLFVNVFMTFMKLGTKQQVTVQDALGWVDDTFYGRMCAAKDFSAEFFSVLSSAVNGFLQRGQRLTHALEQGARMDSSVSTALNLQTTALTGFFHQVALLPLYLMAIGRKTMMCQLEGLVAVVNVDGVSISLQSAQFAGASDALSGQCLTQYAETQTLQSGVPRSLAAGGDMAVALISNAAQMVLIKQMEPLLHLIDGGLTYSIGVLNTFAGVVQAMDLAHCVLPDVTIATTVRCACGDQPLSISRDRAAEGLGDRAYWCTGTISLIDDGGDQIVVWNPYTYAALQDMLEASMDAFLRCGGGPSCPPPPNNPVFAAQGVTAIAVLTRCRQNYVNKEWDPAAYAQYDARALRTLVPRSVRPAQAADTDGVGACLLYAVSAGQTNAACLRDYGRSRGLTDAYWAYDETQLSAANRIDACIVFFGPANNRQIDAARTEPFAQCLTGYASGGMCELSGFVWSQGSSNQVPVASRHVISGAGDAATNQRAVQMLYSQAHGLVMDALLPLSNFSNSALNVGFFSTEGDLIHQLLDCVFLGPFARMDYWPAPACAEGQADCLQVPYWARDAGSGASRGVDVDACIAPSTPPYSCGSPARQAMVQYFVQDYILAGQGGSQVVQQQIRQWVDDLVRDWQDPALYGCPCPGGGGGGGGGFSGACCAVSGDYLPPVLARPYMYLNSTNVVTSLKDQLQNFLLQARQSSRPWTRQLDQATSDAYDWAGAAGSHHARDEARFDTQAPTMLYNDTEALSPPRKSGPPNSGLWHACHGALKQVLFTLPVHANGSLFNGPAEPFQGGGTADFEAHVKELTRAAFESSPLFRHYYPVHHPSDSGVCEQVFPDSPQAGGSAAFSDYTVSGVTLLDGGELSPVTVLGARAARLGEYPSRCFCGWRLVGGRCAIPESELGCPLESAWVSPADCTYALAEQDLAALAAAYNESWECPDLTLTDHLGFLDAGATEAWITGAVDLTTSGDALLRYGAGGLKVGNAPKADWSDGSDLGSILAQNLHPGMRQVDPSRAVLRSCGASERARPAASYLVDTFIQDLFPMAQGVAEGGVNAYCLRFSVEVARLQAMQLVSAMQQPQLVDDSSVAAQRALASLWGRRCGSQLQLVSLCNALDMYHPNPLSSASCAMPWALNTTGFVGEAYVTPQCLVGLSGVFYDPCQCMPSACLAGATGITQVPVGVLLSDAACLVHVDPRTVTRTEELGTWETGLGDGLDGLRGARNAWLADPSNLLLRDSFLAATLASGGSVGNTDPIGGAHWASAEGFLNTTGAFCDMIVDYWPDEAAFPVGYHVTVPCRAEDAGYRSFDNAFALDVDGSSMLFVEDQTRDAATVDSNFGAGGLCRITNFGFDMYHTNTMRVCTRAPVNASVDIHVPRGARPEQGFDAPVCSESSADLPWADHTYYDYYDPAFYSVGTVPNLPRDGDTRYPGSADRYMLVGPMQRLEAEGWGDACGDLDIPSCADPGHACATGFHCLHGVCMSDAVECIRHSDCASPSEMCSGDGQCQQARVSVLNRLASEAGIRAHTASCSGASYSMLGASHWGYVPDVLQAHGMCSYRSWQQYLYTNETCSKAAGSTLLVNGSACPYYRFDATDPPKPWWQGNSAYPDRLRMIPTTCDRDYERMALGGAELRSCVPDDGQYTVVDTSGGVAQATPRDTFVSMYDTNSRTVALRAMPFMSSPTWGFLGANDAIEVESCSTVHQCFADTFTVNGVTQMAIVNGINAPRRDTSGGTAYDAQDIFQCGVAAYYDAAEGKCRLDTTVLPLYNFFCPVAGGIPSVCASSVGTFTPVDVSSMVSMCQVIQRSFAPSYTTIHDTNTPSLAQMFDYFNKPTTLAEHLATTACVNSLYASMPTQGGTKARGLYYPFTFTLYELPFSWFYQCTLSGLVAVDASSTRNVFACPTHASRITPAEYKAYTSQGDDFATYVTKVRGGYTAAQVAAYSASSVARAQADWAQAVREVLSETFSNHGADRTYAQCFNEQDWIEPTDVWAKVIIRSYVNPTCSDAVLSQGIKQYNELHKTAMSPSTVSTFLTEHTGATTPQVFQSYGVNDTAVAGGHKSLMRLILDFGSQRLQSKGEVSALQLNRVNATQTEAVQYDPTMPDVTDPEYTLFITQALNSDYLPASGTLPGYQEYTDNDCPRALSTLTIGSEEVLYCPVFSTGPTGCAYPPFAWGVPSQAFALDASSSSLGNLQAYFTGLYSAVRSRYALKTAGGYPGLRASAAELPFFTDEDAAPETDFNRAFVFDLTRVRSYMMEINPNPNTPVMCTIGNQTINFTQCTDPNFLALQQHVRQTYLKPGPRTVPPGSQLDWDTARAMLVAGAIYSFASTQRDISRQYLLSLFDNATSCLANNFAAQSRVCQFTATGGLAKARSVTPWLTGSWNPFDKCDVTDSGVDTSFTETVDVACQYGAPVCDPAVGASTTQRYYQQMPNADACIRKQGQKTVSNNVYYNTGYNLCKQTVNEDDVCQHDQGMAGGTDGIPVQDFATTGNLYSLQNFTDLVWPEGADLGLFGSVLLAGGAADYGFIRVPASHIGGHHLGLIIEPNANPSLVGSMRVARVPLKAPGRRTQLDTWDSRDVREWVAQLNASIAADDAAYQASGLKAGFTRGWECPLRQRAFYTGSVPKFAPSLPSARRSKILFGDLTGGKYAHPTQSRGSAADQFGPYTTTNGFCFCPLSEEIQRDQCSVPLGVTNQSDCSLWSTIQSLRGNLWLSSRTFAPRTAANDDKACGVQMDWPFVGGSLRDGSAILASDAAAQVWAQASDVEARRCHVLDRMDEFRYQYASEARLRPSGATTLASGVCHTGRVQRVVASSSRCVRTEKNADNAHLRCEAAGAVPTPRPSSKTPAQATERARLFRQRCSTCSPVPVFKSRGGVPIPAESSFGVPYRHSAERALAADLREAVCAGQADCGGILNETSWAPGAFMAAYLTAPHTLFLAGAAAGESPVTASVEPPDDTQLWARPWVYCGSKEALRTGANCTGAIPKHQWRANKVDTCHASITLALDGRQDPMAQTAVCNMDGRLSALCQAIDKARSLVASANCIASGDPACAVQEFVYSPSTWETSNQQFVHETVRTYYNAIDRATPDICPSDIDIAQLKARNAATLQLCPAVPISAFAQVLGGVRGLVVTMTRVITIVISMGFHLLSTLGDSGGFGEAKAQAILDWQELKRVMGSAAGSVSDLFADLILFQGAVGPWLLRMGVSACNAINDASAYFKSVWCNLLIWQLPAFLGGLKALATWCDVGFQTLNDFMDTIFMKYLPQAFMDMAQRGYRGAFQSDLFGNKKAAYEKRQANTVATAAQGVPMTASERAAYNQRNTEKTLKNAGVSAAANNAAKDAAGTAAGDAAKTTTTATGETLRALGTIGTAASVVMDLFNIYQGYETAKKIAEAMENYPKFWTVFDFDGIYSTIDDLVSFIAQDVTCYASTGAAQLSCSAATLPTLDSSQAMTMAPTPTMCWAEAQERQLGVSTLYACTASSTCMVDAVSEDTVLCAECPVQLNPLFRTYGCNTMQEKCQCGAPTLSVSSCSSNSDCGGSVPTCKQLGSTDDVSFGANMCSQCARDPVCLITSAGLVGQCTCLSTGTNEVARCSADIGSSTSVVSTKLCGYSPTAVTGAYFLWRELSLIGCANVKQPICAEVIPDNTSPFSMAVSTSATALTLSPTTRRLLAEDAPTYHPGVPDPFTSDAPQEDISPSTLQGILLEPGWNETASPCSTLALAYQRNEHLGPTDEVAARTCAYWRHVGREVIRDYNLTAMRGTDTFLLSPDDFAAAVGRKDVAATLMRHPQALVAATLHSRWLKPVRAIFRAVGLRGVDLARLVSKARSYIPSRRGRKTAHNESEAQREESEPPPHRIPHNESAPPHHRNPHDSTSPSHGPSNKTSHQTSNKTSNKTNPSHGPSNKTNHGHSHSNSTLTLPHPRRRLLGLLTDTVQSLRSSPFANVTFQPPSQFNTTPPSGWLVESLSWPSALPPGTCPPVEVLFQSTRQVVAVTSKYYQHFNTINTRPALPQSLSAVIPDLRNGNRTGLPSFTVSDASYSAQAFHALLNLLGISIDDLMAFLKDPCEDADDCAARNKWTLAYIFETSLACDYEALSYCSRHTRDLLFTSVFVFLLYYLVTLASSALGIPFVSSVFFVAMPWIILWHSMGYSPACTPMVPPCLVDDLIAALRQIAPESASFPPLLVCRDAPDCLVPCSQLGFEGWQDPLLFVVADLGLDAWVGNLSVAQQVAPKLTTMAARARSQDAPAYRICAGVTAVSALPVIFALGGAVYLLGGLLLFFLSLGPPLVSMVWHVLSYNHSPEAGGR